MGVMRPMYTTPETHPCTRERHEFGVIVSGVEARCRCGARTLPAEPALGCETILLVKD